MTCVAKAFKELDRQEDQRFDRYMVRNIRAWYTKFPPTPPDAGGTDDREDGPGGGGW